MPNAKKKSSDVSTTIILVVVFIVGLSLLVYPSLADYINYLNRAIDITDYVDNVASMTKEYYDQLWSEAVEYNANLPTRENRYAMTEEDMAEYNSILSVGDDSPIGYIEIPSIDTSLPIYHGTSESTLLKAIGHLEWSSLPTGGAGTHCVISGHRGLPSARLFTDIDRLVEGDIFIIRVLDEVLTYEVDQIHIVEPDDTSDLQIVEGEDYCTLVTCTPYGINTHRMLVRGHRIENIKESVSIRVTADAIQIEPVIVAPLLALPMLILLMIIVFIRDGRKKSR